MSLVVVTGASGFIAQHVISLLLQNDYKVVGTVRNQEKANRLSKQFDNIKLTLELVPDIAEPNAFDEIFKKYNKSIEYVIHIATPVTAEAVDLEREIITPAIEGTKSILEAIKTYSAHSVKKVVLTSSGVTLAKAEGFFDASVVLSEDSWNSQTREESLVNGITAYYGSKTFAERAAWDFAESNKDFVKFQLTVVNPGYVFGPQLFDESASGKLNVSSEFIRTVFKSKPGDDLDAKIAGPFIDVRDVAKSHILPLEDSRFASKRLLLFNTNFALQDAADVINDKIKELSGKIASGKPGSGNTIAENLAKFDNSKTRELLGFEFISFEKSIVDTVSQLLRAQN